MKKVRCRFHFHPDGLPVDKLSLVGSWTEGGEFSAKWENAGKAMRRSPKGYWWAEITLKVEKDQTFYWGVKDENEQWMLFESEALDFIPKSGQTESFYLGYRQRLGLHRDGDDGLRAAVWAPNARAVALRIGSDTLPMVQGEEFWELRKAVGWKAYLGSVYGFEITTKNRKKVLRADPYARVRQGPKRGVSDLFLSPEGEYRHRYSVGDDGSHHLRFEAVLPEESPLREPPHLRLYAGQKQLNLAALKNRLQGDCNLPEGETWWRSQARPDGTILMVRNPETEAYSVCLGPESATRGLRYEIIDENQSTHHDPWEPCLDGYHNWARLGIVCEYRKRSRRSWAGPVPHEDLRLYELHVGSVLGSGGNLRTSTFGQLAEQLPAIKKLGFNALSLMPTNATEGWRDWGYLGTAGFAHQEAYADEGLNAEDSLMRFVDRAHSLGLKVVCDVVYNHIGGHHNDLWEFDGLENPWFERDRTVKAKRGALPSRPIDTSEAKPRTVKTSVRDTPWGPIPAYNRTPVYQFFMDHALDQVDRVGFDGIRFDFTHLIHAQGSGGTEGWRMLQGIHHRLNYFFPHAVTFAEEFPPHPIITRPVTQGGAGFSGMWNTEHQHRLVFDHNKPSVMYQLLEYGKAQLEPLLQHILCPEGFSDPGSSATVLSNHDEVGNAQRIYNLVKSHPRGLDIARLISVFSLLCPGYPILFQGTEDLADNYFSWGLPHTWDVDSHLRPRTLAGYRKRHLQVVKDALKLRAANSDLWARVPVSDAYLHEDRQLLAIRRGAFWIVGNFGPLARALPAHLTEESELVFNAEKKRYGYGGKSTRGSRIGGLSVKVWRRNPSRENRPGDKA